MSIRLPPLDLFRFSRCIRLDSRTSRVLRCSCTAP